MFTRDPAEAVARRAGPGSVIIAHANHPVQAPDGARLLTVKAPADITLTMEEYQAADSVFMVGVSRLLTPSTRISPIWEHLFNTVDRKKIIAIDVPPYRGEIWRLWFSFWISGTDFDGYTYSYLLETHYKTWRDGKRPENPLSMERIRAHAGDVQVEYERFFEPPSVAVVAMPPSIHRDYQALKAKLFDEHDDIKPIIKGLADFAKKAYRGRLIPQEHKMFDTPEAVRIVRTDLKVDEYLAGQLIDKIDEVNAVCEALQ